MVNGDFPSRFVFFCFRDAVELVFQCKRGFDGGEIIQVTPKSLFINRNVLKKNSLE